MRNTTRLNYAFKRITVGLGFEPVTNRIAITSTTKTLIGQVVDRFSDQVNRAVCEDELGTTLVLRLEALAGLTISPFSTASRTWKSTFVETEDRVINGGTGSRPKGVEVHPAIFVIDTLGRDNFTHGDHLARAIGDVAEASTPVTTGENTGELARASVTTEVTAACAKYVAWVIVAPATTRGDAVGADRGSVTGYGPGCFGVSIVRMGINISGRTKEGRNNFRSVLNTR